MLFSLSKLLEDHLYHLVILLAHHHLNDNHCPQQYTSIVADMITYTISNIPCNLFVLIWHLPFNLHYRLNNLHIWTPNASGMPTSSKTDELSEKFQTAFDPEKTPLYQFHGQIALFKGPNFEI